MGAMDAPAAQRVRFTFADLAREITSEEATQLSQWLEESARTARAESAAAARGLSLKILAATTSGKIKIIRLSEIDRATLLGTKLRDVGSQRAGLGRLVAALKAAEVDASRQ